MFVISAEGGGDEQLSEAGIQLKYASGVAGHNWRHRRRNDAAYAAELMNEFSLASENYGLGYFSSVCFRLQIYRLVPTLLLRSSKVLVLITVTVIWIPACWRE